jgi:DNA-binding transcriptional regulator YiaG
MMIRKRLFSHKGSAAVEPFQYRGCGLDDIYLVNGFTIEEGEYGRGVAIHDIESLHRTIALHIISEKKRLTAKEFKFLRKEMDRTQAELAGLMGVDAQTIARYEKGESEITGPVDGFMRTIFCLWILPPKQRIKCLERIKVLLESDETQDDEGSYFETSNKGWIEARI